MANLHTARATREEGTAKRKVLTFALATESYGIDIAYVTEIIGLQKITPVPEMPAYVRGVINLRGRVIPVMDVRIRFGLPGKDPDPRTCIVVISVEDTDIGLLVDTVQEVLDIPATDIAPPPGLKGGERSFVEAMAKVHDDVKILLDARALLFHHHLDH
jgi:purine-binding chemotaxis protein CheW